MPGVWFFSLDAASPLAVRAARRLFHLPYFDARMRVAGDGAGWRFESERGGTGAGFSGEYAPDGPSFTAPAGSLEAWLTERFFLYSADGRGRLWRGEVRHNSWPLHRARVNVERCSLVGALGLELEGEPLAHFSGSVAVRAWPLRPV